MAHLGVLRAVAGAVGQPGFADDLAALNLALLRHQLAQTSPVAQAGGEAHAVVLAAQHIGQPAGIRFGTHRLPQLRLGKLRQTAATHGAQHHAQRQRAQLVVVEAHTRRFQRVAPGAHHPVHVGAHGAGLRPAQQCRHVDADRVALVHHVGTAGHVEQVAQRDLAVQRALQLGHVILRQVVQAADQALVQRDAHQQRGHALGHGPAGQTLCGVAPEAVVFGPDPALACDQQAGDRPLVQVILHAAAHQPPAVVDGDGRHLQRAGLRRCGDQVVPEHGLKAARVVARPVGRVSFPARYLARWAPAHGVALRPAPVPSGLGQHGLVPSAAGCRQQGGPGCGQQQVTTTTHGGLTMLQIK